MDLPLVEEETVQLFVVPAPQVLVKLNTCVFIPEILCPGLVMSLGISSGLKLWCRLLTLSKGMGNISIACCCS